MAACLEAEGGRAAEDAHTIALWLTPAAARAALRGALTPLLAPNDGDDHTDAADAFWSACERGRVEQAPSKAAAATRLWDALIGARLLTTPSPASADVTTLALLLLVDSRAKLAAGRVLLGCYREAAAACASAAAAAATAPPHSPAAARGTVTPAAEALDRVMVQLVNVPDVALTLAHSHGLLRTLFAALRSSLIDACAADAAGIVDAASPGVAGVAFLRPLSDLHASLSHPALVAHTLSDPPTLAAAVAALAPVHGTLPLTRRRAVDGHVPQESPAWAAAVQAELLLFANVVDPLLSALSPA